MAMLSKQCKKFCKFCADAGKPKEMVESHYVKDKIGGKPCCPTLAETECPYCHAKGHTWGHCERRKSKAVRATQRKASNARRGGGRQPQTQANRKVGNGVSLGDVVSAAIQRKQQEQTGDGFTLVARGPSRKSGGGGGRSATQIKNGFASLKQQQQQQQQATQPKSVAVRAPTGVWGRTGGLRAKIAENVEIAETAEAIGAVAAHVKQEATEAVENVAAVQQSIALPADLDPARDFGDDADSDDEATGWGDRC